ncbi:MAG: hypothetical protein NVSMB32_03530 [Actinomycetota bacterium]
MTHWNTSVPPGPVLLKDSLQDPARLDGTAREGRFGGPCFAGREAAGRAIAEGDVDIDGAGLGEDEGCGATGARGAVAGGLAWRGVVESVMLQAGAASKISGPNVMVETWTRSRKRDPVSMRTIVASAGRAQ